MSTMSTWASVLRLNERIETDEQKKYYVEQLAGIAKDELDLDRWPLDDCIVQIVIKMLGCAGAGFCDEEYSTIAVKITKDPQLPKDFLRDKWARLFEDLMWGTQ